MGKVKDACLKGESKYYLGLNLSNILIIGHTDQGYFQNVFGIVLFPNKI